MRTSLSWNLMTAQGWFLIWQNNINKVRDLELVRVVGIIKQMASVRGITVEVQKRMRNLRLINGNLDS